MRAGSEPGWPASSPSYAVETRPIADGTGWRIDVEGPDSDGRTTKRSFDLAGRGQQDYLDFFARVAAAFGTRVPRNRRPCDGLADATGWRPLLTRPLSERIRYGYGDPAVLRVDRDGRPRWYIFATSNDAPDAFPILRSDDLEHWELGGFVFPEGSAPAWTATGRGIGDFWAAELHRVGGSFLLCFTARQHDGLLAIGLARASHPEGPFAASDRPFLTGRVIDPNLFVDEDGSLILLWKQDNNGVWPRALADLLHARPDLVEMLFPEPEDARTAALAASFAPLQAALPPMERFFRLQPLIEASVERYAAVRASLTSLGDAAAEAVVAAMQTPIYAQRLSDDGERLIGERHILLVNDLPWEGHLIEGPWLTRQNGAYFLFYSGNDFCTSDYGIGVAVADDVFGHYRKQPEPLLHSSAGWLAPGHPSLARGPDDEPWLFFHAYPPGEAGYKAFRALLAARLRFGEQGVEIVA